MNNLEIFHLQGKNVNICLNKAYYKSAKISSLTENCEKGINSEKRNM